MGGDGSSYDISLGMGETILLLEDPGTSSMHKLCTNTACTAYLMYNFKLLTVVHGQLEVRLGETESGGQQQTVTVTTISPDGSSAPHTLTQTNTWITVEDNIFVDLIKVDSEGSEPQYIDILAGLHTYCLPAVGDCSSSSTRLEVRVIPADHGE